MQAAWFRHERVGVVPNFVRPFSLNSVLGGVTLSGLARLVIGTFTASSARSTSSLAQMGSTRVPQWFLRHLEISAEVPLA